MNLAAEAPQWLALVLALLLIAAAIEDAARLRISNVTSGLILAAAVVAAVVVGPELALWQNLVVLTGLLAIGTPMFAAGKFGGGDVKLFAVSGLWFDLGGAFRMIVGVLIAGGVLALMIIALRAFRWSEPARERIYLLNPKSGIPYGVAIAVGTLIAVATARG